MESKLAISSSSSVKPLNEDCDKDFPLYCQRYHQCVTSEQFQFSPIKIEVPGNSSLELEISFLVSVFKMMSCEAV